MKLVPLQPPGRVTRKARDFEADIVQLRAEGYTLDAIRKALDAAGVRVSISTVRREALRRTLVVPATSGASLKEPVFQQAAPAVEAPTVGASSDSTGNAARSTWRSGKDVADAYVSSLITNPFVRAREKK